MKFSRIAAASFAGLVCNTAGAAHVRISFAASEEKLERGLEILAGLMG